MSTLLAQVVPVMVSAAIVITVIVSGLALWMLWMEKH